MTRRNFSPAVRKAAYERAQGRCEACQCVLDGQPWDCDHVTPDAFGGLPTLDNAAVLCVPCHRGAGGKTAGDLKRLAKAKRMKLKHETGKSHQHRTRPIQSRGFDKTLSRRFDGSIVRRV